MEKQNLVSKFKWSWHPCKRRKNEEDPLFFDGNAMRSNLKILLPPSNPTITETMEVDKNDVFVCQISKCGETFSTVADFEMHHSLVHRNTCSQCKRRLPNSHLLDLHVAEEHDTLFSIQAQSKDMYGCYVPSCREMFKTPAERKQHAVNVHKYPSNFRFAVKKQHKSKKAEKPMQVTTPDNASVPQPIDNITDPAEAPCLQENRSNISESGRRFVYNVPKDICFGAGSQKGFMLPPRGRGRRHQRGGRSQGAKVRNDKPTEMEESLT